MYNTLMDNAKKSEQYSRKLILAQNAGLFLVSLLLVLSAACIFLRYSAIKFVENELETFSARVSQELTYENGKWDTSQYASDPQTPHPNGSSGFSSTLYIISTDGFIIERNAPISGLLDSSDFNHLMAFQKPQTLTNITNEQWRVLSKPITNNGKTLGVIMVSIYNPDRFIREAADEKLQANLTRIEKKIIIKNGEIDTNDIDIRAIDFDVSLEVVNTFNKVLLNNGRIPTYIDKSYVYNELKNSKKIREFKNPSDKKTYVIVSQTLFDGDKNPVGIVLTGKSISFIDEIFSNSLPYIALFTIITLTSSVFLLIRLLNSGLKKTIQQHEAAQKNKQLPTKIMFDKNTSILTIDDKQIQLPYDSNQYYLVKTIFSNSKKRYEVDELLEIFGHEASAENWRKVYDAMNLVNKKVEQYMPVKLIELKDKTYQLNPRLYSALKP